MVKNIFQYSVISLAVALGLTACGGGSNDKAAQNGSQSAAPAGKAAADKQGITINNGAEPESLDPNKVSGVPESNVLRQMLIGLTNTDPDGKTIPGMAEKWESADGKVWTFHLRDAKWSNGDPVTADDFVYSFRRLLDPKTASPYASYLADAKVLNAQDVVDGKKSPDSIGVKAVDAKTLEITLTESEPYFPDMLIHTSTKPVNKKAIEKFGEKWTSPENMVVNGPYKLKAWEVNSQIVLERNSSYYDDAKTKINQVTFLPVSSQATDVSRYKAGEIDVTYNDLPTEQFAQIKSSMADELKTGPYLCTYYYELNNTKPPFNDPKVRRALMLSLDRDTLAAKVQGRGEQAAYEFTPPSTNGMTANTPEWKAWDAAKRIEEAKKLLAEAGYSEAKPLKFELLYNTSENHKKMAVAATALWKQALGDKLIDITLANQEWKTYLDSRRHQNFTMSRAAWCGDYNEPSSFLNMFKSNNSGNYGKYKSDAYDQLIGQTLKNGVTPEQRSGFYQKAEAEMDKDAANVMVYHYANARLVKPYVEGYTAKDPLDQFQVKDWSLKAH